MECKGPGVSQCLRCQDADVLMDGKCLSYQALDAALQENFIGKAGDRAEKCGKGFRLTNLIACDDGNLADGDGCNQ